MPTLNSIQLELSSNGDITNNELYEGCVVHEGRPNIGDFVTSKNKNDFLGICIQLRLHGFLCIDIVNDEPVEFNYRDGFAFTPSDTYLKIFIDTLSSYIHQDASYIGYISDKLEYNPLYDYIVKKLDLPVCSKCGKSLFFFQSYNGKDYCLDCYDSLFSYCYNCNERFPIEDLEVCKDGNYLCSKCAKREFILPYHHIYPETKFFGNNKKNSVPFMGIELEVDEGGFKNSVVKRIVNMINKENNPFLYCSRDGSLENGFEIITQPATLEYHNSIKDTYKSIFDRLIRDGYLSHDTSTCGLHIHFNRSFYKDNEKAYLQNLIFILDKYWDDVVRFSRRNSYRLERFSKKVDFDNVSSYIENCNKSRRHEDHYYSLNISNEDTIEFRMFKGTLNIDTFMATLQFVYNCIMSAKYKSFSEITAMKFEELITGRVCKKYWNKRKDLLNTEE